MTDDPTVCNECACAFCEDRAQVIDLCPTHAPSQRLADARQGVVTALEEVLPEMHKRAHSAPGYYTCTAGICVSARAALKELEEASK